MTFNLLLTQVAALSPFDTFRLVIFGVRVMSGAVPAANTVIVGVPSFSTDVWIPSKNKSYK